MADSVKKLTDGQLSYLYHDSLKGIKQKSKYDDSHDVTVDYDGPRLGKNRDPWSYTESNDYDYYKGNTNYKSVEGLEGASWGLLAGDYKNIDSGEISKDGDLYGDVGDMFQRVQDEYSSRNAAKADDGSTDEETETEPDTSPSLGDVLDTENGGAGISEGVANAMTRTKQFWTDRTEGTNTEKVYGRNPRSSEVGDDKQYSQKRAFDWLEKYKIDLTKD